MFYIDGKQILNIYDNNEEEGGYITESGYFGLNNYSKMVMEPTSKKDEEIKGIPVRTAISEYTPDISVLKADYKILGDTEFETAWYRCDGKPEWDLIVPDMIAPKEIIKIEGSENKDEYTPTDNDTGKYIMFGITDSDGNLSLTEAQYIDPVAAILSHDIYMVFDNSLALANGEKVNVDENAEVTPTLIDTTAYVPIRFVIEKAGGEINWNEEKRAAEIKIGNYVSLVNIDDTNATVNGEEVTLKKAPIIENDRTMLCVDDINTLTELYAKNFHDCIISVTKEEVELSVAEVAQIETHIIR